MRKLLYLFAIIYVSSAFIANAQKKAISGNAGTGNLRYVDPRIGNVSQLLVPTRPTVQLPNQVIRMYPMRNDFIDYQISSFPLSIVSHRLGEVFSIKPYTKAITPAAWTEKQAYDHDLEITRPWYYSTWLLDDEIGVAFTPGKKAAIYRFEFPASGSHSVLLGKYNNGETMFNVADGRIITGMETYHNDIKVFLYGEFSMAGKAGTVSNSTLSTSTAVTGNKVGAFITFPTNSKTVELRYAISFVSAAQAKANFVAEVKGKAFEQLKADGENAWAKVINQIKVEGGTEAQRRSFYTAYYRCNERMVDITEDNQYYSGYDGKIHQTQRPFYVDDWTWDTYLAQHPLRAILNPAQEADMVNSYVNMYQQSGWVPTFPVLFGDHVCMNGFHSTVMILDAYRKGIRNFDAKAAYAGMLKNADEATMLPWRNGPKTSLDDFYYKNGFFPALHPGEAETVAEVNRGERRQAVAVTLGASYDDWALSQFATELGNTTDVQRFAARASNYKNLWNAESQMFLPKDDKGEWIKIDPKFDGGMGGRDYYDENNGWTYLWQVQHDIKGLQDLMGGKINFEGKLDQLFREPLGRSRYDFWHKFPDATGLVGQYSMGNEPSFHIPYLYNFTNSPWKTQQRVRFLLDLWYKDNVFGIPGDEDGGGMSAFAVFSSMGFYPVTPGLPVYTIGSPVFSKVTIDLPNGKVFKLITQNSSVVNKYIQSAKLNGKVLTKPWFTHAQLVAGATLELVMGPKPNKSWGK